MQRLQLPLGKRQPCNLLLIIESFGLQEIEARDTSARWQVLPHVSDRPCCSHHALSQAILWRWSGNLDQLTAGGHVVPHQGASPGP
jgi:hypothetical protein